MSDLLFQLLEKRVKLSTRLGLKTQEGFETAFHEASMLRIKKIGGDPEGKIEGGYGEKRYDMDDMEMQLWLNYADIWRKFGRMQDLIKQVTHDKNFLALQKFRDDAMDIANYGLMAVQIIDKFNYIEKLKLKQMDRMKES